MLSRESQPYGLMAIHPRPTEVGVFLPGKDKHLSAAWHRDTTSSDVAKKRRKDGGVFSAFFDFEIFVFQAVFFFSPDSKKRFLKPALSSESPKNRNSAALATDCSALVGMSINAAPQSPYRITAAR